MPLTPNSGSSAGGTPVTITGSNLSGTTAVRFGTTPATSFTNVSATQVDAVSPAGHGVVGVTVTTPGGTSNPVPYFYIEPPQKFSISESSGAAAGGESVTITGQNLNGTSAVNFGPGNPGTITATTPGSITVTTPAGTGTVPLTLTTPAGTTNGLFFTFVAAPDVTGVAPGTGPEAGGTSVTITGTNLTTTNQVLFGATPASFVVQSDTEVTAVTPAGTGTVGVTVNTDGGTDTLPASFVYAAPPGV